MTPLTPWRQEDHTSTCPMCGRHFVPVGRQRHCSDACRQAAWRRRQAVSASLVPAPTASPRALTVYCCPACEMRLLGVQRCPDCHIWARRVGPGGLCPHCDEPVAFADLTLDQPSPEDSQQP